MRRRCWATRSVVLVRRLVELAGWSGRVRVLSAGPDCEKLSSGSGWRRAYCMFRVIGPAGYTRDQWL